MKDIDKIIARMSELAELDRSGLRVTWQHAFSEASPHFLSMLFMRKALIWDLQCKTYGGVPANLKRALKTAANGKTIQTVHTDAEGRMAWADALVLASREKPGMIFDYATLTGSCIRALTTRYSGVFSNRSELHPALKRVGRVSGERVWPFPIGEEFLEDLKSDTADFL